MPRRTDIKTIMVIGSGPIVIGQACEFDYSGTQACQVLRQEGYRVILVNSNPATIMTDPATADVTYVEPLDVDVVTDIIAKERPDALLPTLGGQTALNLTMELVAKGVPERYGVEVIGARPEAISTAEDRELFKAAMADIGLAVPVSGFAHSVEEALEIAAGIGYPIIIRPSFILGGAGTGIAHTPEQMRQLAHEGIEASPVREILVEQSIAGWKEYELEVMRDKADNCIIVCSIENFDPMGVHTGDSPADLVGRRVPGDARRRFRRLAPRRRRDRWLERTVRRESGQRRAPRYRDEPPRESLFGPGLQGHGLPDRQDRGPLGRGLHLGRDSKRHHQRHPGQFRADH